MPYHIPELTGQAFVEARARKLQLEHDHNVNQKKLRRQPIEHWRITAAQVVVDHVKLFGADTPLSQHHERAIKVALFRAGFSHSLTGWIFGLTSASDLSAWWRHPQGSPADRLIPGETVGSLARRLAHRIRYLEKGAGKSTKHYLEAGN